jgi:hypothetical protein
VSQRRRLRDKRDEPRREQIARLAEREQMDPDIAPSFLAIEREIDAEPEQCTAPCCGGWPLELDPDDFDLPSLWECQFIVLATQ